MQQITTEFGFSESSYICPAKDNKSNAHIRIFTPMEKYVGWEKPGKLNKPTLFIWCNQDVSFPFDNTKKLSELIPHKLLQYAKGFARSAVVVR